ncbi:MAG: transcription initiation factor TFIIIB [Bacillota bacterium]|nr:transcription initiation factor TFIIIB [Bacillota bacterium]
MEEGNKVKACPICGCTEIGQGKLTGYSKMMPLHTIFSNGSDVIADICLECGHIISMRVTRPDKFK